MAAPTRKPTAKQFSHRLGSIWVTPETAFALDRLSAETGKSINEIIREALAAHLRRRTLPGQRPPA